MHGKQVEHDIWDGKIKSLSHWVRHESELGRSCLLEDIEKNQFDNKKKKQSFKRKGGGREWIKKDVKTSSNNSKDPTVLYTREERKSLEKMWKTEA